MPRTLRGRTVPETNADDAVAHALDALLADGRSSVVVALADDWACVAVPASLAVDGCRVPAVRADRRTLLDLVCEPDRAAVEAALEQARGQGIAVAIVHALDDPQTRATLTVLDARELHGVWLAVLTCGSRLSATSESTALGQQVGVSPSRQATMHKSDSGIITRVGADVTAMLGWAPEQLIGRRSTEFIHPDDHDRAVTSWMDLYSTRVAAASGSAIGAPTRVGCGSSWRTSTTAPRCLTWWT